MELEEARKRQGFLDHIASYTYIHENGRLDLESFCVYLSHCFGCDDNLEIAPRPIAVYGLLLEIIQDRFGDDAKKYVQMVEIPEWTPELGYVYPNKYRTCIHIAALVRISSEWIYQIGHTLMGLPEPDVPESYFGWVREDWVAVHTFINGYHNQFFSFLKASDLKGMAKNGFSAFEALYLTQAKGIDFDEAVALLLRRHESYQDALRQVRAAIKDGYFLEAIVLQECLISNCLFNFLKGVGVEIEGDSLHSLLQQVRAVGRGGRQLPADLLQKVDNWRRARNAAIHGFIATKSGELVTSRESFAAKSGAAANDGIVLCEEVIEWYEVECISFVPHEFPLKRKKLMH